MTLELGAADCQAFIRPYSQLTRACQHLEWFSKQVDRHRSCQELNQVLKILVVSALRYFNQQKIYLFC